LAFGCNRALVFFFAARDSKPAAEIHYGEMMLLAVSRFWVLSMDYRLLTMADPFED
jgi:hypothetical protein